MAIETPERDALALELAERLMRQAHFDALPEYSCSLPTGVYVGKMWKRHDGAYDRESRQAPQWKLGWFGTCNNPESCSVNFRKLLVI